MKPLLLSLLIVLGFLQYRLWIGTASLMELNHMEQARSELEHEILELTERNESLAAEVMDLKHGKDAVEERARSEMGMIRADEVFYQIIEGHNRTRPAN